MSADHNPYSPPVAPVRDPESRTVPRPRTVYAAILLIASSMVVAVFDRSTITVGPRMQEARFLLTVRQYFILVFTIWIGFMLARGRNWARYVLLAYIMFEVLNVIRWMIVPGGLSRSRGFDAIALFLLPALLYAAALYLVFVPARGWFRPRD